VSTLHAIGAVVSLALFLYLFIAMFQPERFE
jgi:K+-transporting ATPase KdpF subunit